MRRDGPRPRLSRAGDSVQSALFLALGLVLIIEGLMPLLFPRQWRQLFQQIMALTDGQLRFIGLLAVIGGLLLVAVLK